MSGGLGAASAWAAGPVRQAKRGEHSSSFGAPVTACVTRARFFAAIYTMGMLQGLKRALSLNV